jgi:hypothetical protein
MILLQMRSRFPNQHNSSNLCTIQYFYYYAILGNAIALLQSNTIQAILVKRDTITDAIALLQITTIQAILGNAILLQNAIAPLKTT